MTQGVLPFKRYRKGTEASPEKVEVVGLTYEDEMVTLRFMSGDLQWGQPARQIRIDRKLAEELSRLLANELEDYARA